MNDGTPTPTSHFDVRYYAALGALLASIPFIGVLFASLRLPAFASLPVPIAFGSAVAISIYQGRKHKDGTGVTWYGKYGNTPGAYLLWGFMYTGCIAIAGMATVIHFPGWGRHYIGTSGPLYTYITEGRCEDGRSDLCSLELCNATAAGNVAFERQFCSEQPSTCKGKRTSYDWSLRNCMRTCGCKGIFDPVYQSADGSTFNCERTGTCYQSRNFNVMWVYVRHPWLIEIHVVTGVPMMLAAPLQFLERVRQWKDLRFHRWNGRILLLLLVPNQISAVALAVIGIADDSLGPHAYSKVFRVGLGLLSFFTLFYGACAFYFIRKKDIRRHGEFMMRLMSCWFTIPLFRMLNPFFETFFGSRWSFGVSGWCWIFAFGVTEVYICKSERFVQPSNAQSRPAVAEIGVCQKIGAIETKH